MLNRLTFEVQNALADQPELQEQLLNASVRNLEQLADELDSESPVRLTLAIACVRLGESSHKQGHNAAAARCFARAEMILDGLSETMSEQPDILQCRVWLLLCRGELSRTLNDAESACRDFSTALQTCRQIENQTTERVATLHAHALSCLRLWEADCAAVTSADEAARTSLINEAIVLLERSLEIDADADDIRYDLASAYLQRAKAEPREHSEAAGNDAVTAVELLELIPDDSRLRGEATAAAVSPLVFIASHGPNRCRGLCPR